MSEVFDARAFAQEQIKEIGRVVGSSKVLVAISGGVDSTTAAVLTHRAIGANLVCIFIDDNFMRLGETERVRELLSSPPLCLPLRVLDERMRFMKSLKGLKDAEEKRKAFRETFYQVLGEAAKRENCTHLVQGTIRADVVETAQGVKTQHNVLEQIGIDPMERFGFRIIEPLVSLFKYQVRELARSINVPAEISQRQPFPGPGLSVRVVGRMSSEKLDEVKMATAIVEESFKDVGADQYFAAVFEDAYEGEADWELRRDIASELGLPVSKVETRILREKGTGVAEGRRVYGSIPTISARDDDGKTIGLDWRGLQRVQTLLQRSDTGFTHSLYRVSGRERGDYIVAVRAVKTGDFMTAEMAPVSWSKLQEVAEGVLRACPKVASVCFDIAPKPPATIEFE